MKTKKLFWVIIVAVLFAASYIVNAQEVKNNNANNSARTSIHNHHHSSMMSQSDSTSTNQGMIAMMKQCEGMMQMMQNMNSMIGNGQHGMMNNGMMNGNMMNHQDMINGKTKSKNSSSSSIDPGTKKGSYAYFQYQREKNS